MQTLGAQNAVAHIAHANQVVQNKQEAIEVNEVIAGDAMRAAALAADSQLGWTINFKTSFSYIVFQMKIARMGLFENYDK